MAVGHSIGGHVGHARCSSYCTCYHLLAGFFLAFYAVVVAYGLEILIKPVDVRPKGRTQFVSNASLTNFISLPDICARQSSIRSLSINQMNE